jgi:hypothetical protein
MGAGRVLCVDTGDVARARRRDYRLLGRAIIGVYPDSDMVYPIGQAMQKNLTLHMGNCHHRRYLPMLVEPK